MARAARISVRFNCFSSPIDGAGFRRNTRLLKGARDLEIGYDQPNGLKGIAMALDRLDHITVRCSDLARSRTFYVAALGFEDGDRPPFNFPGAWLYVAGRPVVHLVGGPHDGTKGTGTFDHVAFAANDLEGTRRRLEQAKIASRETKVPGRP